MFSTTGDQIASEHAEYLIGEGVDPGILVGAVSYLAHMHAIPPMADDERWFAEMLQVLVELIVPNICLNNESVAFLRILRSRLDGVLAEFDETK